MNGGSGLVGGGVKHSGLVGGGVGLGGWFGWSRSRCRETCRWSTEVSTILISDSRVWNSQRFSKFTTKLQDDIIISDVADSLLKGEGHGNWFSTVIWSSHVDILGGEEPTLDGLTVESSFVLSFGSSSKRASSLGLSSSNGTVTPLWCSVSVVLTRGEFTMSSSDIRN